MTKGQKTLKIQPKVKKMLQRMWKSLREHLRTIRLEFSKTVCFLGKMAILSTVC